MSVIVVGELTADAQRIILIANGPDAEVAMAARKLELLTPLIKVSDPPGALQMPATWPGVVQLSATFGAFWRPGPRLQNWISHQVQARTAELPQTLSFPLPVELQPREYQVAGAQMVARLPTLLWDEPGTGKTITAILGLRERAASGAKVTPAIVVAPASVVDSWVRELHKWAPHWRSIAWRGSPASRARKVGLADVYVVSYDLARRDAQSANPLDSPLIRVGARTVIADEAHKIKNHGTAQAKAVVRLGERADWFIPMTGTPITHHPADLWPSLKALTPGAWPSRERWVNRYCIQGQADYGEKILGLMPHHEAEFRTVLLGQNRRVAKADVLAQLPPKVYSVREVELPAAYRKAYDDFEAEMLAQLPDDGGELSVMDTLSKINFLATMASAACDVEYEIETVWDDELGMEVEKTHTHLYPKAPSWKVDAMLELLEEREGLHTIVTAPSKRLIDLAGVAAEAASYRVGYIVGGQKPAERTANIDAFQAGKLDAIFVTTSAGGVGITLTAASAVAFLMRPYSLVDATQMEDRAHRIGSERHESIEMIDFVAKNTIDSRVRQVLKERAGSLSELVKDPRIAAEILGGASVTKINGRRTA
jgi:SNF2 family DNA or RNA helicase